MKQPFWKHYLSHIYPFTIEVTEGIHNPYLEVIYTRGRYQLNTENAIYSYEDLYTNYYKAFQQLDLQQRNIKNVLILGLGLGSIPVMLERHFKLNYHFTGVEIDEAVMYLANKYALKQLSSPVETICADALIFVEQCQQKFDLICTDIFLDDEIPEQFQGTGFLEALKKLLSKDGLLLYNRLAFTQKDKELTADFYKNTFKKTYPKGRYLELDDNWMLLNR